MNELVTVIIIIVIVISFFLHYESFYSELTYVKSGLDNRQYLVRNLEDKQEAADMLATIRKNLDNIVAYLKENNNNDERISRLIDNYRPEKLSESIPNTNYTSYSVNKGEKIVFCIRSKDKRQKLVDINTIMFVAIHELAHVMTKSIGHTEEFWNNMKYLLKKAIKLNIYKNHDYREKPVPYCGTEITDSPLN
jgi:predicted metal-dependent hydrolase